MLTKTWGIDRRVNGYLDVYNTTNHCFQKVVFLLYSLISLNLAYDLCSWYNNNEEKKKKN